MTGPIAAVADHLRASGVRFAVIGAAAMSTRGFPRQTLDIDLLTTDRAVLAEEFWTSFSTRPEVRRGDPDDPLVAVVRFRQPDIDIVVGRALWQADAVSRAEELFIGGLKLPVVTLGDLILLKLDAGGYRDAADIKVMMAGVSQQEIERIESVLPLLCENARRLWAEIRHAA